MGDGGGQWGTVLHSDVWGKFQKRPDGTTECRPSSSLILTCRATLENNRTGRQAAVRPGPGSGRTDCPVESTGTLLISLRSHGIPLLPASAFLSLLKPRIRYCLYNHLSFFQCLFYACPINLIILKPPSRHSRECPCM